MANNTIAGYPLARTCLGFATPNPPIGSMDNNRQVSGARGSQARSLAWIGTVPNADDHTQRPWGSYRSARIRQPRLTTMNSIGQGVALMESR